MQAAIKHSATETRPRPELWLTTHDRRRRIGGWQAVRRRQTDGGCKGGQRGGGGRTAGHGRVSPWLLLVMIWFKWQ